MPEHRSAKYVIVGGGVVGWEVSKNLSDRGIDHIIISPESDSFKSVQSTPDQGVRQLSFLNSIPKNILNYQREYFRSIDGAVLEDVSFYLLFKHDEDYTNYLNTGSKYDSKPRFKTASTNEVTGGIGYEYELCDKCVVDRNAMTINANAYVNSLVNGSNRAEVLTSPVVAINENGSTVVLRDGTNIKVENRLFLATNAFTGKLFSDSEIESPLTQPDYLKILASSSYSMENKGKWLSQQNVEIVFSGGMPNCIGINNGDNLILSTFGVEVTYPNLETLRSLYTNEKLLFSSHIEYNPKGYDLCAVEGFVEDIGIGLKRDSLNFIGFRSYTSTSLGFPMIGEHITDVDDRKRGAVGSSGEQKIILCGQGCEGGAFKWANVIAKVAVARGLNENLEHTLKPIAQLTDTKRHLLNQKGIQLGGNSPE